MQSQDDINLKCGSFGKSRFESTQAEEMRRLRQTCPHCYLFDLANGTPSKKMKYPPLTLAAFIKHLGKEHHVDAKAAKDTWDKRAPAHYV